MNYAYNGNLLKKPNNEKQIKKEPKENIAKLFSCDYVPTLLDAWQVADILGVTVRTVANYRYLGYFPAYKISKRNYKYRSEDIKKFIESARKENPFD